MSMDILLAAPDTERGEAFRAIVEDLGARCTVVLNLTDLYQELSRHSFHGILLDSFVTARATEPEKALIHDLLGRIPVLRIYWDDTLRGIGSQLYDASRSVPLSEFLKDYCDAETPVFIRDELRLPFHLNVLVAPDPETLRRNPERAITLNLSERGAFLLTPNDWSAHQTLWIEFCDLVNDDPIEVEICWRIPWGLTKRLPGVGIRFTGLAESLKNELRETIGHFSVNAPRE